MTLLDRFVAQTLPLVPKPIVRSVASRYISGETAESALDAAAGLNRAGMMATMDILGEDIMNLTDAARAAEGYRTLLDGIAERRIQSNVSIKLSQFGLRLNGSRCLDLVDGLVRHAASLDNFVRIDMEDSSCTSDTIDVYRTLRERHVNVGLVIQASLRRTLTDVESLLAIQPNFRLCKGVYVEPRRIAYRDMRLINANYLAILRLLFEKQVYVGIATHDETLVYEATRMIRSMGLPPTAYEFQMLLGVDEELRDLIVADGHRLRVYIPFGKDWYAYSVRRLRENPRIAGYVLRAMLRGR